MKSRFGIAMSLVLLFVLIMNVPANAQRSRGQQVRSSGNRSVQTPRVESPAPKAPSVSGTEKAAPAPALTEAQKKDIENTLQKAMERFQSGDIQKAGHLISLAENLDPALSPPATMLAKWAAMAGNTEVARTLLDDAVVAHPEDPEAFLLLADIARTEKRRTEATLLLARGQELLENYTRSSARKKAIEKSMWLNLANLAELKRDYTGALACLDKLISGNADDGDNIDITVRYGMILAIRNAEGDEQKSLQMFEKAFKSNPELLPPKAQLAQILLSKNETEKAEKLLEEAARECPEHFSVLSLLVGNYMAKGQIEEAQKVTETLKKLRPDSVDIDRLHGKLALAARDLRGAEDAYQRVLEKLPLDKDANEGMVMILLESGDEEKLIQANRLAESNLRRAPSNENAALLAWTFFRIGKKEQAERLADQVLSRGLLSSNSAYFIAEILAASGKTSEARSLIGSSLESSGNFFMRSAAEQFAKKLGEAEDQEKQ